VGGRVHTVRDLVPGLPIGADAELIALNHPCWLDLARAFGFALSVITSEDNYIGAGLEMPIILEGESLSIKDQKLPLRLR
jgi:hypothetical protein